MQTHTLKNRTFNWTKLTIELISYAYIMLFLYASIYKLEEYAFFLRQLTKSPLLGDFSGILAWLVPSSEIIAALLLMFFKTRTTGLWLSLAVMTTFTAYIIYILNFSPSIPCSCGGILATMGWTEHLVFNIGFMLQAILAIVLSKKLNP
jgi:hypothetical protein